SISSPTSLASTVTSIAPPALSTAIGGRATWRAPRSERQRDMARIHAFCFASGHIEFGASIPDGALAIAHGRQDIVRNLIEATARHGYKSRRVKGRITKIPGTDCLLVPGIPEAPASSQC